MCVKFTPHLSRWKMLKSPSPPQWFSRWLTQWAEWSAEDQTSQNIHLHIWCLRAKHSSHGYRVWNRIFSLIHTAMETVSHTNWTALKFDGVLNFQKGSWGDLMSINRFTTILLIFYWVRFDSCGDPVGLVTSAPWTRAGWEIPFNSTERLLALTWIILAAFCSSDSHSEGKGNLGGASATSAFRL